jgi:hypothetical protein
LSLHHPNNLFENISVLFALLQLRIEKTFLGIKVIGKGICTPLHPTNHACGYKFALSFKFSR